MRQKHCSNIIQMFTNINRGRGRGLVTCQASGTTLPNHSAGSNSGHVYKIKQGGGSGYA